jgi:hypothetical protein
MFCANCGKKIDDDALFCPHCGAKTDAPDAPEEATPEPEAPQPSATLQPEAPAPATPEPVTPQPATPEPAATPTPEPVAAAAPPVAPPPVTTPPAPAAAAPPPAGTPPAVTDGQPPKKGSSKCWFIGCGILLVVGALTVVGILIAGRYAITKGGEAAQDIRGQLEDQGFQFEGQDSSDDSDDSGDSSGDDSSSAADDDSAEMPDMGNIDWDQISDNMPEGTAEAMEGLMSQLGEMADSDEMREAMQNLEGAAPTVAMHMFFAAWQMGNVDEARKLMTDDLSDQIEDGTLEGGHIQQNMDVQSREKLSDNTWEFRVEESFQMNAGADTETELYRLKLIKSGDKWLIDELEILDEDD